MTYALRESNTSKNFTPNALVAQVFGQRRVVKEITIHHWGLDGQDFDTVERFLCTNNTPTSAHYVAQDGLVSCIVSPDDAAWHTGSPVGNATTIGIELRPEATDGDYRTAGELVRFIRGIYGDIPLVPHKRWHATACPGRYDLDRIDRLARQTVTVQREEEDMPSAKEIVDEMFSRPFNRGGEGMTGQTDLGGMVAWNDAWNHGLGGEIAAVRAIVSQLAVKQGVTIDYDAIAKAVNDDAAKRLAK